MFIVRKQLWFVAVIILMFGFIFAMKSYSQEDSKCKISELVKLKNGEANRRVKDVKEVRIFDPDLVDRTPLTGVNKGHEIGLGYLVRCRSGVNTALKTREDKIAWLNYDTVIQVEDDCIGEVEGEVYSEGARVRLKDGTIINPQGTEFYVKAGTEGGAEKAIVYVFGGSVDVKGFILDREKPVLTIGADGTINPPIHKDMIPEHIENNLFRARLWRDEIRHLMAPFWAKPQYYAPAAVIGAGVAGAVIYKIMKKCDTTLHVTVSR